LLPRNDEVFQILGSSFINYLINYPQNSFNERKGVSFKRGAAPLFWLFRRIGNNIKSMTGQGLESLIPKKSGTNQTPPQDFSISPQQDGERPTFFKKGIAEPERARRERSEESESENQAGERLVGARDPVFSRTKPVAQESIFQIEVEKIKPNPYQPRRDFNDEEIEELARSIREFGVIQPLVVTKIEKETETGTSVEYELIAGERRLLAAKKIGLRTVPAIVKRVDIGKAKLEMALVENIQRSNLNPIETARGYARLQDEFNLTQQEIAARVGKSRAAVANTMRLLTLPSDLQEALLMGKITTSQAFAYLSKKSGASAALKNESPDPEKIYWEKRLEERFGAPVVITRRDGKGKMEIKFHSQEEWQAILDKLLGESNRE